MGMFGADVEALRALARDCANGADRLAAARVAIESQVANASWQGLDADDFRERWWSVDGPGMAAAEAGLREAAVRALANADQQEQASAAGGAGGLAAGAHAGGVPMAASAGAVEAALGAGEMVGVGGLADGAVAVGPVGAKGGRDPDPNLPHPGAGGLDVYAVDGTEPFEGGLGPARKGTSAPVPDPPRWVPPDAGADQVYDENGAPVPFTGKSRWNTEKATWDDKWNKIVWQTKATGAVLRGWDDAGSNLMHYLDGSGTDCNVDVDGLLKEVDRVGKDIAAKESALGKEAVRRAQASGATGPVTFPINTDWERFKMGPGGGKNWYLATNDFDHSLTGTVTAYPPDKPGGPWRYEMDTTVNFRDRYNWDSGKSTDIEGKVTTDVELGRLHQTGIAQEFNLVGESSTRHSESIVK